MPTWFRLHRCDVWSGADPGLGAEGNMPGIVVDPGSRVTCAFVTLSLTCPGR
jgi:hypothetical protein